MILRRVLIVFAVALCHCATPAESPTDDMTGEEPDSEIPEDVVATIILQTDPGLAQETALVLERRLEQLEPPDTSLDRDALQSGELVFEDVDVEPLRTVRPVNDHLIEVDLYRRQEVSEQRLRSLLVTPGRVEVLALNDSATSEIEFSADELSNDIREVSSPIHTQNGDDLQDHYLVSQNEVALRQAMEVLADEGRLSQPTEFALGLDPHGDGSTLRTYLTDPAPILTNQHIIDAEPSLSAGREGPRSSLWIILNEEGQDRFTEYTTELVGRRIGIVFDNRLVSSPIIAEPITAGRLLVNFRRHLWSAAEVQQDEVLDWMMILRGGALPTDVEWVEMRER